MWSTAQNRTKNGEECGQLHRKNREWGGMGSTTQNRMNVVNCTEQNREWGEDNSYQTIHRVARKYHFE